MSLHHLITVPIFALTITDLAFYYTDLKPICSTNLSSSTICFYAGTRVVKQTLSVVITTVGDYHGLIPHTPATTYRLEAHCWPYGYSYKASCAGLGLAIICNF